MAENNIDPKKDYGRRITVNPRKVNGNYELTNSIDIFVEDVPVTPKSDGTTTSGYSISRFLIPRNGKKDVICEAGDDGPEAVNKLLVKLAGMYRDSSKVISRPKASIVAQQDFDCLDQYFEPRGKTN